MLRLAMVPLVAVLTLACAAPALPSRSASGPSDVEATSASSPASDPVAALAEALRAAGATLTVLGSFPTDPLGGRGTRLCVSAQEVRVYAFETEADQAAVATKIDPTDPSMIGASMIVEWAGNPTFWQQGRLIVLYLGSDPAVEAGLSSVLGQPFAKGFGRDPGPGQHDC